MVSLLQQRHRLIRQLCYTIAESDRAPETAVLHWLCLAATSQSHTAKLTIVKLSHYQQIKQIIFTVLECKVYKSPGDIYIPPVTGKPEQQQFTN